MKNFILVLALALFGLEAHATYQPQKVDRTGDTMSGGFGLSGAEAADRALYLNSTRNVSSSIVTSTELGYLSGVTAGIQSQINTFAMGSGFLAKAGDTMTGNLGLAGSGTLPSTVPYLDADRLIQSSSVTPTELGYLSGLTAAVQGQVDGRDQKSLLKTIATGDSPYTVLATDQQIVCDSSAGGVTVTLPAVAASGRGRILNVAKIASANTCVLHTDQSGTPDTIQGLTSQVISNQWENLTLQEYPGSNSWLIK